MSRYREASIRQESRQLRDESIQRGIDQTRIESIKSIMETLKLTAQQAMDALKIPKGEQGKYMARL